jgi:hypothetical protein
MSKWQGRWRLMKSSCTLLQDTMTKGHSHGAIREMMRRMTGNKRSPEPEAFLAECPARWKVEARIENIQVNGVIAENGKGESPQEGGTELLRRGLPLLRDITHHQKKGGLLGACGGKLREQTSAWSLCSLMQSKSNLGITSILKALLIWGPSNSFSVLTS